MDVPWRCHNPRRGRDALRDSRQDAGATCLAHRCDPPL